MSTIGKNKISILLILLMSSVLLFPSDLFARTVTHGNPKTANYFLHWDLNETQARELSKWDVVILDMEVQERSPLLLRKMREWNPNIMLLAYITPQEIQKNPLTGGGKMRARLSAGIPEVWYLTNSKGMRLSWWPGTYLLNVTSKSPIVNGQRFNQYLAQFVSQQILATGMWDGVFYDNAWDSISFFAGSDVDTDKNGVADTTADADWKAGMRFIYEETRRLTGGQYVILGNGTTRAYADVLNGMMLENFIPQSFGPTMQTYAYDQRTTRAMKINIINANTSNRGSQTNYREMRFGLASSLLEDGYYAFDFGDQNHGQTWYYDEYDVNLGNPIDASLSLTGQTVYSAGVWTRSFENGLAVVNSTNQPQTVNLGGEYEKIHGAQDKVMNDGSIISELTLSGYDGTVLLKTFSVPNDVVFDNGAFARFFHSNGVRARNGTFVFEEGYLGNDSIAHVDLDGNGKRDTVVASGAKLSAWRDDGQPYLALYPYTASYKGQLRIAIGDSNGDSMPEIYVAPSDGYPAPIKVYSRYGDLVKDNWFPYGKTYKGGYSVALGNVDAVGKDEIVIGGGVGKTPTVTLFSGAYALIREWLGFEKTFRGGVSVAAGNLDGAGGHEIIVGAGKGKGPVIRVFDSKGKQIGKEFSAYTTKLKPGIEVSTVDIDFDGKDEIMATSQDIGL